MSIKDRIEARWYADSPGPLALLTPLEWLFKKISRNKKAKDQLSAHVSPVPVVVVGNLSVGGTGKTPVIISLAKQLAARGLNVGIVSRGYGRSLTEPHSLNPNSTPAEAGDEPIEIFEATRCPMVVAQDRALAIQLLNKNHKLDVILSDDGMQHYRMGRHAEVLVVSEALGFGNGHCLPVGPLRESTTRLNNVDFVLINKAVSQPHTSKHSSLRVLEGKANTYEFTVQPVIWRNVVTDAERPLDSFQQGKQKAYAGIGQPEKFFSTLENLGVVFEAKAKTDHANYSALDFNDTDVDHYLMTAKDAVKCKNLAPANSWYLQVDTQLPVGFVDSLLKSLNLADSTHPPKSH